MREYFRLDDERCDAGVIERMRTACFKGQWPILLYGHVGRGKSFLAAYVYTRWTGTVAMMKYCDLVNCSISAEKNETFSFPASDGSTVSYTPGQWWRWIASVGLLIVDEIGSGYTGEWREEVFWKMLELRKHRPLLMTSNKTLNEVRDVLGERIASRVMEGTLIELIGEDQRMVGVQKRAFKCQVNNGVE